MDMPMENANTTECFATVRGHIVQLGEILTDLEDFSIYVAGQTFSAHADALKINSLSGCNLVTFESRYPWYVWFLPIPKGHTFIASTHEPDRLLKILSHVSEFLTCEIIVVRKLHEDTFLSQAKTENLLFSSWDFLQHDDQAMVYGLDLTADDEDLVERIFVGRNAPSKLRNFSLSPQDQSI